jgi:hypothetical protein
MGTTLRFVRRSALLAGAFVAAASMLAPQAFATEDTGAGPPGTQMETPPFGETLVFVPECFGEPATIVMTTSGAQRGTSGDDVIVGTGGDDFIDSLGGHDKICAGGGVDRVTADYDPDTGRWDPLIIVVGEPADPDDDLIDGQDDGDVVTPGTASGAAAAATTCTARAATTRSRPETARTGWTAARATTTTPTAGGGRTTGSMMTTAARP